jgi:hypothetical protein
MIRANTQVAGDSRFPLGVFVGGFRWSGSGAVSDWLAGREGFLQHAASGASFGEIRALNYGLRYLTATAAGSARWGERLGRRALCPDPALMPRLLGRTLSRERRSFPRLYDAADALVTAAARFFIIPGFKEYKPLLDAQLGRDFRQDDEYCEAVAALARELRAFMRRRRGAAAVGEPWRDDAVRLAASHLIGIFHERLGEGGAMPIFDNAFSGLDPELFGLVSDDLFKRRVFILVRRDPRDQFADLVRFSGSTFAWSSSAFVRQYRRVQGKTADFLESMRGARDAFVRLVNFEDFVLDTRGTRTKLRRDLEEFWNGSAPPGRWIDGSFSPEKSARNIGFWRNSGLNGAMRRIARELPDYLVPAAEAKNGT